MTEVKVFHLGQMSQSNVCSGHYGSLPVILCPCMCVSVCVYVCVVVSAPRNVKNPSPQMCHYHVRHFYQLASSPLQFFHPLLPPAFLLSLLSLNLQDHNKGVRGQTICHYIKRDRKRWQQRRRKMREY